MADLAPAGFGTADLATWTAGLPILDVTNLGPSGPGSFPYLQAAPFPKRIRFKVWGTIWLDEPLTLTQTLMHVKDDNPRGCGITFAGEEVRPQAAYQAFENIAFRSGEEYPARDGFDNRDCAAIGKAAVDVHDVFFHRCSFSFSVDELFTGRFGSHDITAQWCVFGMALHHSVHPESLVDPFPGHSMGPAFGDGCYNVTLHHNLIALCNQRNPQINAGAGAGLIFDVRNNVIYGWGELPMELKGRAFVNVVGNYWKRGPNTPTSPVSGGIYVDGSAANCRVYIPNTNKMPNLASAALDNWNGIQDGGGNTPPEGSNRIFSAHTAPAVTTTDCDTAYLEVLANAGMLHGSARDPIDEMLFKHVRDGTGDIVDSVAEACAQFGGRPTRQIRGARPSNRFRPGGGVYPYKE